MNRRQLLSAGIIGLTLSVIPKSVYPRKSNDLIKPMVLTEGDEVGIIAPGTSVSDPDDIQKAIQTLNFFGLKTQVPANLTNGKGYKSRSITERVDDLHQMFNNKNIKAVFCIRGGYGSMQILDKLDYNLIKNNPKIFIGFSDITALHLAIGKFSGLVTFHGPVLLSAFSNYTIEYFKKAVFSNQPIGTISNPEIVNGTRPAFPFRTISQGTSNGKLIGGNLSLISSLMGTPYEFETEGKILFLEDVGEDPYRIDRMLTQLNLAKKLEKASGIVFGICTDCDKKSNIWDYTLGEVLDQQLSKLKIPVLYGLLIGHTPEQITIPYGIEANLDADKGCLTILESCFEQN